MSKGRTTSTGLSFGSVLFFIFLVMKLTHYVDWPWWQVTAPLWLPIIAVLAIAAVFASIGGLCLLISRVGIAILERRQ